MQSPADQWIAFYNLLSIALWVRVGVHCGSDWAILKEPLLTAQTFALFDILHAALKLVRSPLHVVFVQVASRLQMVWLIFRLIPEAQEQWGLFLCCFAWTLAEILRFTYYFVGWTQLRGATFRVLSWLRYSAFVVLYPIGIFGEIKSIVAALPRLQQQYTRYPWEMPNWLNFEINLHAVYNAVLLLYFPGSVWLYAHMLAKRRKKRD